MDIHEIIDNTLNLKKDLHNHGEECFESCSDAQIHSVCGLVACLFDSETADKIIQLNMILC